MSNMNNNNQVPLQPLLPQGYMNNQHRRGNGMYWGNQYNYPNNNNQFYRRNTYYNRNYQQGHYGYDNGGYGITNARPPAPTFYGAPRRFNRNRPRSRSGEQRSGPRQIRLNDFMPSTLRNVSPSGPTLPTDFNQLNNGPTTDNGLPPRPPIPVSSNALPQRPNFRTQTVTTNNTTQPFNINQQQPNNGQNQRQQATTTTAAYRRRNRRNRQQSYRQNQVYNNNNNRFAAFDQGESTDVESNYDDQNDIVPLNDNYQQKQNENKKKKQQPRLYLEPSRIMRYMQENSTSTISGRGNQAFVLATTSIYDAWVRHNYELQVWQTYLKMGTDNNNHWAKEVIQRTKKRDAVTCTKFVQKKINQLLLKIGQASASISDLQIQLGTYWSQTAAAGALPSTTTTTTATTTTSNTNRSPRDPVDRIEKAIVKYLQHCTQHVKKMAESKIQLAKAQMEEFKALEDFQQIATPLQWNIHLTLKTKLKTWSTKNKNYRTVIKRVEYDLPPKFISKTELSFKVDESILSAQEAQVLYNDMRRLTKDYRTQAMTLYVQSTTREYELLSSEIDQIIKGFPRENDDGFDCEPGFAAFKHYNDLREKRYNLEADLSIYFLDVQRVEGDMKDHQEEIVAPTLTRSLGEDFLLQQ